MSPVPAERTRHALEPTVNGGILPVFVSAAAFVVIPAVSPTELSPAFWGIAVALPVGKIVGISLFGWLAMRIRPKGAPPAMPFADLLSAGALGGIGFTVSLLLANLAFAGDGEIRDQAILGVLVGSFIALALSGVIVSLRARWYRKVADATSDARPRFAAKEDAVPDPIEDDVDALRAAAETMRAVRDRCVWSQRITHRDLVPYLIEESHEVIDAVEDGSRADLREELGGPAVAGALPRGDRRSGPRRSLRHRRRRAHTDREDGAAASARLRGCRGHHARRGAGALERGEGRGEAVIALQRARRGARRDAGAGEGAEGARARARRLRRGRPRVIERAGLPPGRRASAPLPGR